MEIEKPIELLLSHNQQTMEQQNKRKTKPFNNEQKNIFDPSRILEVDSRGIPILSPPILEHGKRLGMTIEAILKAAEMGRLSTAVRSWFKGENLSRPSVLEGASLLVKWYEDQVIKLKNGTITYTNIIPTKSNFLQSNNGKLNNNKLSTNKNKSLKKDSNGLLMKFTTSINTQQQYNIQDPEQSQFKQKKSI